MPPTPMSPTEPDGSVTSAPSDRRVEPRLPPSALPPFSARLIDGPQIDIVNVSKTGLLARSEARLLPGATIGLRFVASDKVFVLLGKVVRSRLVALRDGHPMYESGLAFERHFPLLAEDPVAALAEAPAELPPPDPAEPPPAFPREIGRFNGEPTVLTVTAFAHDRGDEILKAFQVNEW